MFKYNVNIFANSEDIFALQIFSKIPKENNIGINEISLSSVSFPKIESCIQTASQFLTGIVNELSLLGKPSKIFIDSPDKGNELLSISNISEFKILPSSGSLQSWQDCEILRMYLVKDEDVKNSIFYTKVAVSIFSLDDEMSLN